MTFNNFHFGSTGFDANTGLASDKKKDWIDDADSLEILVEILLTLVVWIAHIANMSFACQRDVECKEIHWHTIASHLWCC